MTKFSAFVIIIALRLIYQPSHAPPGMAPFASPSPSATFPVSPAKLISVNGSIRNHKVILQWLVGDNETADQFEVEKSRPSKVLYRIKLINKNRKTKYSTVVEINPNV